MAEMAMATMAMAEIRGMAVCTRFNSLGSARSARRRAMLQAGSIREGD